MLLRNLCIIHVAELGEEAQKTRNKDNRLFKQHDTCKIQRNKRNTDLFESLKSHAD